MKAWLLDGYTGIGGLRLDDVPAPLPQPGEALLEVYFAALNPADRYLAERQYPAKPIFPHILGRDGMGIVVQEGRGPDGPRVGQRAAVLRGDTGGNRPGTFAEQVTLPAESLVDIPTEWSNEEAAGATLVYLTAYQALTMWGQLPQSSSILISGASGGVGVAAVQLGAALGHNVLALSRSPEKSLRLRELGASATFHPDQPDWRRAVKDSLGSSRVELAIDNIGGKVLPEMIETLGEQGKVSLVGRLAGPVPEFNTASLFFRRLRLGGVAVGAYTNEESHSAWKQVVQLLSRTGARPQVDSVFSFHQLPKAFARLAEGPLGKVLLQVKGR